jgi:hypothetical protein
MSEARNEETIPAAETTPAESTTTTTTETAVDPVP